MHAQTYFLPHLMGVICLPFASVLGSPVQTSELTKTGLTTTNLNMSLSAGNPPLATLATNTGPVGEDGRTICNQIWNMTDEKGTAQCQDIDKPMQTCQVKSCTVVVNDKGDVQPAATGLTFQHCIPDHGPHHSGAHSTGTPPTGTPPTGTPPTGTQPKGTPPNGQPPNGPPPKGQEPKGSTVQAKAFNFTGDGDFIRVTGTDNMAYICRDSDLRPGCNSCSAASGSQA